jgi:hypothetical protein
MKHKLLWDSPRASEGWVTNGLAAAPPAADDRIGVSTWTVKVVRRYKVVWSKKEKKPWLAHLYKVSFLQEMSHVANYF